MTVDHSRDSYWLQVPLLTGVREAPREDGGIAIVGSGLAGVSTAYWLLEHGYDDAITLIDYTPEVAATNRNCGHILNGTVESMAAFTALHGFDKAKQLWGYSVGICDMVRDTIQRLSLDCDYRRDGYLVIAIDEAEKAEILESIELLARAGFKSEWRSPEAIASLGFRGATGGRYEQASAHAHPVKFRNALLKHCLQRGVKYFSGIQVQEVVEQNGTVQLATRQGSLRYDAAVIAANAYNPLLSRFFRERRLIEPFRGQIITSAPLKQPLQVRYPVSFDHGYIYALGTSDNCLMIGGWRNHTPHGEVGTYDLTPNPLVEEGLKQFVRDHYTIQEPIEWRHSWAGIMAASQTGLPFIGPTTSPLIFTVSAFTGHGFSWAHGSSELLARIMLGLPLPDVAKYFNPTQR